MLGWRSRPLGCVGGGGTLRGIGPRDGGRLCRIWFAELLPKDLGRSMSLG